MRGGNYKLGVNNGRQGIRGRLTTSSSLTAATNGRFAARVSARVDEAALRALGGIAAKRISKGKG